MSTRFWLLAPLLVLTTAVGQAAAQPGDAATPAVGRCAAGGATAADLSTGPRWSGWGAGLANTRFQPADQARLTAERVPRLTLKWAFGFPAASSARAQPAVAGGRLFVGSESGRVYALDAKSGCTHWTFEAKAGVRTAMVVAPRRNGRGGTGMPSTSATCARTCTRWTPAPASSSGSRRSTTIRTPASPAARRSTANTCTCRWQAWAKKEPAAVPATPAAPSAAAWSRSRPRRDACAGRRIRSTSRSLVESRQRASGLGAVGRFGLVGADD